MIDPEKTVEQYKAWAEPALKAGRDAMRKAFTQAASDAYSPTPRVIEMSDWSAQEIRFSARIEVECEKDEWSAFYVLDGEEVVTCGPHLWADDD